MIFNRRNAAAGVLLMFVLACTPEQKGPGADTPPSQETPQAVTGQEAVPLQGEPQGATPDQPPAGDLTAAVTGTETPPAQAPAGAAETPASRPGKENPAAYTGEITYASGPSALYRNGEVFRNLDPGLAVQPLDLLETGPEGELEMDLRGPGVPGVVIRMAPRSQFYLENSLLGKNQKTTVHLLAGRAVLTVNKLLGGAVGVQTSEAALAVRGTVFTVVISPTQDVLVTCSEGAVEVNRGGTKQSAAPGKVVFHAPGESLETLEVKPDKLGAFEKRWSDLLAQELETLARVQLQDFARTFPQRLATFEARYRELEKLKPTLDRWKALAQAGNRPDLKTLVLDKQVVAPTLLNLKKSLFFLERQVAWLISLEGALKPAFLASDLDGRSVKTVMDLGLSQRDYLQGKFSRVRYAMALFAQMDPESPLGDFLTNLDQEDDIFAPLSGGGAKDVLSR